MKKLFFYGTLAHIRLLEVVLGRALQAGQATPASLLHHAVYRVIGQAHPMIEADSDGSASGILVTGITTKDVARLNFYEGGFAYDLRTLPVETAQGAVMAGVYFLVDAPARGAPWVLTDWVAEWGDHTMRAADEAMGYFGRIDAAELARRFPAIRGRAASYIRGQRVPRVPDRIDTYSRADVTVDDTHTAYSNFYAMREYSIRYRQYNGKMGPVLDRATFVGFDVAIVLPYDPARDCVLLVEQFRLGLYARGSEHPWSLEPIAGHVDVGETPEQAAERECEEEAGLALHKLLPIADAYPSPGASTEYYYFYLGLCDLAGIDGGIAGAASESENILSRVLSYDALMEFVDSGQANNQPLILAANWLARNRERLRSGA